jgi:glycosyltransferase involved in cell wall biosynthesis
MSRNLQLPSCPQVSVLVVSNDVTYLRETLQSVLNQQYCNFEIVVVLNGAAINESKLLSKEFEDSPVQVHMIQCSEESIVAAKKVGLQYSSGTHICIIDSDDIMPINRIRDQVSEFLSNPNLGCLGGQLLELTSSGLSEFHRYPTDSLSTKHSLYRYTSLPHPGVMFLKERAIEVGSYTSQFPWLEDWDLWNRLSRVGEIYNLRTPTVIYRRHDSQVTMRYKREMVSNTEHMLYSILEGLVSSSKPSNATQDSEKWRKVIRRQAFLCLVGLKKPVRRIGILGIREVRRSMAGIAYQRNLSARISRKHFKHLCTALLTFGLDPKFYFAKGFNNIVRNRRVNSGKSI